MGGKRSIVAKRRLRALQKRRRKQNIKETSIKLSEQSASQSLKDDQPFLTPPWSHSNTTDYEGKVESWLMSCKPPLEESLECAKQETLEKVNITRYKSSDEFPGDWRFDDLLVEDQLVRDKVHEEWMAMKSKYSWYTDSSPSFKDPKVKEPLLKTSSISALDKVALTVYHNRLKKEINQAVSGERHYRDAYGKLKIEYKKLEAKALEEKETVRYFWRNEIIESQSRAGKLVHLALEENEVH